MRRVRLSRITPTLGSIVSLSFRVSSCHTGETRIKVSVILSKEFTLACAATIKHRCWSSQLSTSKPPTAVSSNHASKASMRRVQTSIYPQCSNRRLPRCILCMDQARLGKYSVVVELGEFQAVEVQLALYPGGRERW